MGTALSGGSTKTDAEADDPMDTPGEEKRKSALKKVKLKEDYRTP